MKREILFKLYDSTKNKHIGFERLHKGKWQYQFPNSLTTSFWNDGVMTTNENVLRLQYTGLTDKNGVKIFEGDMVCTVGRGMLYIVQYNEASFYLYHTPDVMNGAIWGTLERGFVIASQMNEGIEIIGNIYENPELLKTVNQKITKRGWPVLLIVQRFHAVCPYFKTKGL